MKEISGRKKTLIIAAHDREHASRDVLSFLKTVQEKYTFTEEKKVKKDVSKKKKKKKGNFKSIPKDSLLLVELWY